MRSRTPSTTRHAKRWSTARALLLGGILPLLLFLGICSAEAQQPPPAPQPSSVTVSAAISLKDALDQLGREYERDHPGAKIAFNYAGSGTLQHQIEQGAPVDIFFSAAQKQMDALQSAGLIVADTRHDIVANDLVLIAPSSSDDIHTFQDLAKSSVKTIALGEPETVPAGMYAQQTLEKLGLWDAVKKKAVYGKDVRQVLTYVATGNADAGLVYRTDAQTSPKIRTIFTAPPSSHDPIVYPAAVLKNSKDQAAAGAFLKFLESPHALEIFKTYGFNDPNNPSGKI
ncbi:MAG: molybdate ABC transporter substrate-binding protein [Candidatus Acidiferrales bacterium]